MLLPRWHSGKESACSSGDRDLIPESGISLGWGYGNPLQYSCLENSLDRGAWWATVQRVAKSQTQPNWLNTHIHRSAWKIWNLLQSEIMLQWTPKHPHLDSTINILLYLFVLCCKKLFPCVWFFVTLWTLACQAPLSVEFSRKEYWNGLPCPSPGYLPNPGVKPTSLVFPALAGRFFITRATWEALYLLISYLFTLLFTHD